MKARPMPLPATIPSGPASSNSGTCKRCWNASGRGSARRRSRLRRPPHQRRKASLPTPCRRACSSTPPSAAGKRCDRPRTGSRPRRPDRPLLDRLPACEGGGSHDCRPCKHAPRMQKTKDPFLLRKRRMKPIVPSAQSDWDRPRAGIRRGGRLDRRLAAIPEPFKRGDPDRSRIAPDIAPVPAAASRNALAPRIWSTS